MQNLPIISKFMAIMVAFGVFALCAAIYSTHEMRMIDDRYTALLAGNAKAELYLARANRAVSNVRVGIAEIILGTNPAQDAAADFTLHDAFAKVKLYSAQAAQAAPAEAGTIARLDSNVADLVNNKCAKTISDGLAADSAAGRVLPISEYFSDCAPLFSVASDSVVAEVNHLIYLTDTEDNALTTVTDHTILITYALIIGGTLLVMLLGFFAIRSWLVTPIKLLQAVMGRLANNELGAIVQGLERKDEIGGMAHAVQVFKESGLAKVKLEENLKIAAAETEKERQAAAEIQAQAATRLKFVVESLADGLSRLANGDLLFRLNDSFAAEYDKLRGDFNVAVDRLEETMMKIADTTQSVHAGAGQITQASDDLARRTEQQAASLEQTAAALDQITTTVRKTADSAEKAHHVADTARTEAERSNTVVTETVNAMSAIETSSGQIANIIGVIDEIAFQTNLLALNAGIEAARAGDAGRGFAVVATEVRALAQRSAEAAKEIKTLISASTEQVGSGVKFVGETGKALTRIIGHVSELNHLVGEIAASAKEQATGLGEVNTAVNQMDQVTQQNAAMVEEATAASHSLVHEAESLSTLVGQFRTTNARDTGAPAQLSAPKRAARLALVGPGD